MRITVFTPTYNRGYCLSRLYESLKMQSFKNFEWVIIDDGSVDNTTELVQKMINSNPGFPIIYKKTENGGKHRAINRGISLAHGELIFIVDSDDWLRSDALEWVNRVEKSIPYIQKSKFAGIQGLCVHIDKGLVGKTFEGDGYVDSTTLERNKYGIAGDKAEVYYTEVLKRYPFPEIEEEKFLTEKLVWDRIAHDGYLIRFFNEGIYFCEYLEDGLTYGGYCLYAQNPKQWAMAIHQDYLFGGTNFYNTTIQMYKYYLYERDRISFKEMVENLKVSLCFLGGSIFVQAILDMVRFIVNRNSIYKQIKEDLSNGNT